MYFTELTTPHYRGRLEQKEIYPILYLPIDEAQNSNINTRHSGFPIRSLELASYYIDMATLKLSQVATTGWRKALMYLRQATKTTSHDHVNCRLLLKKSMTCTSDNFDVCVSLGSLFSPNCKLMSKSGGQKRFSQLTISRWNWCLDGLKMES